MSSMRSRGWFAASLLARVLGVLGPTDAGGPRGGEGMVINPAEFVRKWEDVVRPALNCRGREYLRIIEGPEYTASHNLERLGACGLSSKRSLAIREFAPGIEAPERFLRREPLRRIHECVFGVLGLESEPIDPRLKCRPSCSV